MVYVGGHGNTATEGRKTIPMTIEATARPNIDEVTPNRLAAIGDDQARYIEHAHREIERAHAALDDIAYLINQHAYGAALEGCTSLNGDALANVTTRLASSLQRARQASETLRTGLRWD